MKTKLRLLFTVFSIFGLGLTACSKSGEGGGNQGGNEPSGGEVTPGGNEGEGGEQQHTHTYSGYEHDETQHWQVCTGCHEATQKQNHSGGTATCEHKAVCEVCGAEYGELGEHQYGNLIARVAPTCEEAGVAAHYECSVCHKLFNEQKVEVTQQQLVIASDGHQYGTLVAAEEPDCEHDGHAAYYHCSECNKYFDADKHETTLEALKVAKLGHAYGELIAQVDADCEHSGVAAHYECSRCHKLFNEQKEEVTAEQLVIEALGHDFGELIPAANGVPAHYECARCGLAFDENKDAQIDATLYQIRFFDGEDLYQTLNLGINSPVTAPSGTFRTFYNILGYNAKVDGAWDDTLLNAIPNVTGDADYRIVKEVKADKDYLLNDDPDNVLSSSWDTGGNLSKSDVADIPTGATMSNKTTSVLIGTQNGVTTIKIGADFFYAVKNNAFDDTDYIQAYAKFPVMAGGNKYNNIGLKICEAQSYGMAQGQPEDNSGVTVHYNGGSYCLKQLMANGDWQQLKIYVSELKTMLAGVPETNTTEWDAIAFIHPYNAASPESAKAREMKVYDVEFHRIDITQDFVINDCTNMAQVRSCTNTYFNASNNGVNELYDTTVPYNDSGTDYPSGKPTTSLKTGDMAINNITNSGGWESQCGLDISFIVNNIDKFDDNDEIVTYIWGFNNYGSWVGLGGLNESYVNGGGVNMTNSTEYAKNCGGSGKHGEDIGNEAWMEARITIAELKALTVMSAANTGGGVASYTHDAINKSVWLQWHNKAGAGGTPNLVYSVELHHAS